MMKHLGFLGVVCGLLMSLAGPASAQVLEGASVSATCTSYTVSVDGTGVTPNGATGTVSYSFQLTPTDGSPAVTISGSVTFSSYDDYGDFSTSQTVGYGPLSKDYTLSSNMATLFVGGAEFNSTSIGFYHNGSLSCASTPPPPPPPCTATATNSSNFNGTSVPAGTYIWFNAQFKANNVPKSGVTIDFTNGNISFSAGGTSYSLAVPNARITFSASATCSSTTFDSVTNTWMTTVPVSGDDEVFLTGLAWPVPSGGLPGGANPVNFTGTYSSESSAPGLSIQMQWSAAAYSSFTTNYNALQIKAGHQTACGQNNGDHAGTPEGVDSTDTPWKNYLVGGPRGGGGSNFTGSWSGTLNINICP